MERTASTVTRSPAASDCKSEATAGMRSLLTASLVSFIVVVVIASVIVGAITTTAFRRLRHVCRPQPASRRSGPAAPVRGGLTVPSSQGRGPSAGYHANARDPTTAGERFGRCPAAERPA
ncbi:hypothetical protein FSO04_38900 [Paraburkholderia madseniana]|uniref:Uncharacterized protein n=1 Tax=Paraburkholderia madseniana TaxID=2599607 RepID=A0A6N6W2Z4_9BURK|nr:hypothetical protein FSO04_38900 [Paraburkholderia madseniana]